ncbi:hypothetical protein [Tepidimonas alkaliphilus]|uniref:hypothetical protein n=1 Tax=Tepidimonas alkaliphilus TaxID=2588942 RepID=UPI001181652A|nr:hypothetical protein [Tepidimonas alkaliphilus]
MLGVMGGERPIILIRLGSGAVQRLGVGARLGDWVLKSVEPEAALFEHDGQRRRYSITPGNLGKGTPPPAVPPQLSTVPADDPEAALQRAQQQIEQRRRGGSQAPASSRPDRP